MTGADSTDGVAGDEGKTPQWTVELSIRAPIDRVWDAVEDLSLIPRYRPGVGTVEYLSDSTRRGPGISYRCVVPDGRPGWCVERVVEHIPLKKTTVAIPEDTLGLNRMFDQLLMELTVDELDGATTLVRLHAFYTPKTLKARLMNILRARPVMRRRALRTLEGLRYLVEKPESE